MKNRKLMEPGKWYCEFDGNGSRAAAVYDASYWRLLGFETEKEFLHARKTWTDAVHPEDKERVNAHFADCSKTQPEEGDLDIEYRMMTKWGYHWFHDHAHISRREDGSPVRADGVVFDIQEGFDKADLIKHQDLRKEVLDYMLESDDDPIELLKQFAERLRVLINCDQVIYRDLEETRIMVNSPQIEKTWAVPIEYCRQCAHFDAHHPMYRNGYTEMENCQEGWEGIPVYHDCPIKSSLTRIVYCDNEIAGYLAIHYVQEYHTFTDIERETLQIFARILSISLSRYNAKQQNKEILHRLGAVPISPDILSKENIGMWAFELDEGQPPRMYDDETMLGLVGLDHPVPPEEAYHAWYDHIDEGSYDLVTDAVNKMISGEHAEVQYPWHFPDGRTIIVRCGGVRNFEYTKGIRIEGTHQDVTQTLHFDEKERERARKLENDFIMEKLRADSLAFISDNEPDLDSAINFFGKRILNISGCDQVVYRELGGRKIVLNAPGNEEVPEAICSKCPFSRFDCKAFEENGIVLMDDCRLGYRGIMAPADCPAKSSFMQMIYSGGSLVGKLTVHYLNDYHTFSENGINVLKTIAIYLGLLIGRIKEKQAEIAKIEAESSNKAKTEFLFNMSHDIRTPMNAILGYTDIGLNHMNDPDRTRDSFLKIKQSGGHLLNLINDILEMSRIESGKVELSEDAIDMRQVIEEVSQMSRALAIPKSIDYETEVGEIKNPYVYADELHGNEVLINLISNAIKYTPAGGKVRYCVSQISNVIDGKVTYRFEVSDNGIGMSEEFQRHLFEAFSREKTSTVSRQEGAGLGLSIVKKILDLAGGTIRVKSKQGEGSVFTVEVPLKVMGDAAIEQFKIEKENKTVSADMITLEGKKVLLVEDNEMNREIAQEILTEAGLKVDTAEDGEIALKTVIDKGIGYYDYILMDIQMPVMNGYESTKAIRALPNGNRIPIIALSANAFEEDKQKSIAEGMNAHIAKPIDVRELFEVMKAFAENN